MRVRGSESRADYVGRTPVRHVQLGVWPEYFPRASNFRPIRTTSCPPGVVGPRSYHADMGNPDHSIGDLAVVTLDMFIDAAATIGPQDWDKPSNLDGWTLRDLVGHATGCAAPAPSDPSNPHRRTPHPPPR